MVSGLRKLAARIRSSSPRPVGPAEKPVRDLLETLLAAHSRPAVAVLVRDAGDRTGNLVRQVRPDAVVTTQVLKRGSVRHARLAAAAPFDLVVDCSGKRPGHGRLRLFKTTFFHLRPGGTYLGRDLGDDPLRSWLQALAERRSVPERERRSLPYVRQDEEMVVRSLAGLAVVDGHLIATNGTRALAKLDEPQVNVALRLRGGPDRVVYAVPAVRHVSRCSPVENIGTRDPRMRKVYDAPTMYLREYHNAVCASSQVACLDNLMLPDSYRHNQRRRLTNRHTVEVGHLFAGVRFDPDAVLPLAGSYFYLDNEHRGHFGHAMTEQVSRLWGWPVAKDVDPGVRALVTRHRLRPEVTEFELALFEAAGIPREHVVLVDEAVRVERLFAATPMLSMPEYVHPQIAETWRLLGRTLSASAPDRAYPRRIFCSRRLDKRACHNTREVEAWFGERGFAVIYPEDYPLAEQAMIFRRAEMVAGFAGSAVFNLIFAESPKKVLILSPESYTARNEYMIASVLGHPLVTVHCPSDLQQPERGFDRDAFRSAYTVDFERDGAFLEATVAG